MYGMVPIDATCDRRQTSDSGDSPEPSTSSSDQTPQPSGHFPAHFLSTTAPGMKRKAEHDLDVTETSKEMRKPPASSTDCAMGALSREAEVFALQAIHTALLKKLSEVGPVLAEMMKANKMYKSVLCDMGHSKDELHRSVEVQCIRHMKQNPEHQVSDAQAMVIAATALGKTDASPVSAMDDLLGLYRHCDPTKPAAACAS